MRGQAAGETRGAGAVISREPHEHAGAGVARADGRYDLYRHGILVIGHHEKDEPCPRSSEPQPQRQVSSQREVLRGAIAIAVGEKPRHDSHTLTSVEQREDVFFVVGLGRGRLRGPVGAGRIVVDINAVPDASCLS